MEYNPDLKLINSHTLIIRKIRKVKFLFKGGIHLFSADTYSGRILKGDKNVTIINGKEELPSP